MITNLTVRTGVMRPAQFRSAQYYPAAPTFVTDNYRTAETSEMVAVMPNDTVVINFEFEYKGDAGTCTVEVGNCHLSQLLPGIGASFNKGSTAQHVTQLPSSPTSWVSVTDQAQFVIEEGWTGFNYNDIYFLIVGQELECAIVSALLLRSDVEIRELKITGWETLEAVPVEVVQGGVLRVFFDYEYRTNKAATVKFWAALGDHPYAAEKSKDVSLPASDDYVKKEGEFIDIPTSAGTIGIGATPPGTYNLLIVVAGQETVYDMKENAVIVVQKPGVVDSMMGMIMMVMVMGMMIPMMSGIADEGGEGGEELAGGFG